MSDWLHEAWKQGVGSDAIKTTDLVNRTFTIVSVALKDVEEEKGGQTQIRQTYVGTIRFDLEHENVDAWLGGAGVKTQIDAALARKALPLRVKLVLDGKAYALVDPGDSPPAVLPAEPPSAVTAGQQPSADLIALIKDWTQEVGGMGEVQRALNTKTLMPPIALALAYSPEGVLTWRLSSLSDAQITELRLALRGEWRPEPELVAEPGDQIPFE